MKKIIAILLATYLLLSLAACGNTAPGDNSVKKNYDANSLESMLTFIKTTGEQACTDTKADADALIAKLGDTYDTYSKNKDSVASFYESVKNRSPQIYSAFQQCSVDYFKCVAKQGLDDYATWNDAMDDFYNQWNDAMDDYYEAWDDAYGDVYDVCNDLVEDGYDKMEYKEYSDIWSAMYKTHSDAWSATYKAHSQAWSKTYKDYANCWSGFYGGKTDVDAILADAAQEDSSESNENETTTETTENTTPATNISYDALEAKFQAEVDSAINRLTADWEVFFSDITNYETFVSNTNKVETFYQKVLSTSEHLCIKLRAYAIEYAEAILASGQSADNMYDDLDGIYDLIYEDLADDIYDGIYDGLLKDEIYDELYNGVLKKRPDGVEYSDWSDVRSDEYDRWADARSDAYEHWSDARSDLYSFWADLRSELYGDDIDGAKDEIDDFRKDVEKMGGSVNTTTPTVSAPDNTGTEIRADFKAAMDSYEKFFDEYVAIVKKYKDDPTDTAIFSDYSSYVGQYVDMMQKFKDWNSKDLNKAETAYYIEVQARITKKLLEIA